MRMKDNEERNSNLILKHQKKIRILIIKRRILKLFIMLDTDLSELKDCGAVRINQNQNQILFSSPLTSQLNQR